MFAFELTKRAQIPESCFGVVAIGRVLMVLREAFKQKVTTRPV